MKIDWKSKLSSRKFWALIVAQITAMLLLFGIEGNLVTQIGGVVESIGSIVVYMLSEAQVDAAKASS